MSSTPLYTVGCGDCFGQEWQVQLRAYTEAAKRGIMVSPGWNKSNCRHVTVHTRPQSVWTEADASVVAFGWKTPILLPFIASMIAALLIITYVPAVSLWLPVQTKQLKKADVENCHFMRLPKHEDAKTK